MQIFVNTHPTLTHFDWVRNMMVVCRRWKSVLVRTPHFWAALIRDSAWDLYGFTSTRRNAETWRRFSFAVEHSGSLPLDLYLTCVDDSAVDFLIPYRCRIVTLFVSQNRPQMGPAFTRLIAGEFALLERLSIAYGPIVGARLGTHDQVPYAHIEPTLLPRLCALELPGSHLAVVGPLRFLRHLTLQECGWDTWCSCSAQSSTCDDLLEVLQHCQGLETLALRNMTGPVETIGRVVRIAGLRDLRIEGASGSASAFLTRLAFPPTTSLYLSIDLGDARFMELLPTYVRDAMLAACGAEHVRFRGAAGTCTVEVQGANGQELRITEHRLMMGGYDRQLLQIVDLFSGVPRVELQLYGPVADDTTLRRAWSGFTNLRSFEMIGCDARLHLLPFMDSPEGRHSLQALEHLSITWNCGYDQRFFPRRRRADLAQYAYAYGCHDAQVSANTALASQRPYDAYACEAFCDLLEPVLASQGSVQSLLVLIMRNSYFRDLGPNTCTPAEKLLQGRLGRLVSKLKVVWY